LDTTRRNAARISYGSAPQHFGDLRVPARGGVHPVVVLIHGGFWRALYDLEYLSAVGDALAAAGIATWNIEYRRIGNPGGGYPGTFHDVARAIDFLRELAPRHNLDLARVVTLGHSAGGHLAVWAAARTRIPAGNAILLRDSAPLMLRAAFALAGVVDLRAAWRHRLSNQVVEEFIGGAPEKFPERYAVASPMELLPLGVKQVLVHGTEDENVPLGISADYVAAAAARGDDATLIAQRGAGHFEMVDPSSREWAIVFQAIAPLIGV
jgi:acetyl esterase/lipase